MVRALEIALLPKRRKPLGELCSGECMHLCTIGAAGAEASVCELCDCFCRSSWPQLPLVSEQHVSEPGGSCWVEPKSNRAMAAAVGAPCSAAAGCCCWRRQRQQLHAPALPKCVVWWPQHPMLLLLLPPSLLLPLLPPPPLLLPWPRLLLLLSRHGHQQARCSLCGAL